MSTSAIPALSIASGVGVGFRNINLRIPNLKLPQRIGVFAQPTDGVEGFNFNERYPIFSDIEAGQIFGFGSPIHSIAKVLYNIRQSVGDIPVDVYPIEAAAGAAAAAGSIDATGTQTAAKSYDLFIGSYKVDFTLNVGDTAAEALAIIKTAIDANINMPVVTDVVDAGSLPLAAKWSGITGNDIKITLVGLAAGITFTVNGMAAGAGLSGTDDALANLGEVWETLLTNQFYDEDNLDAIQVRGDQLWAATIAKPFVAFYGSNETDPEIVSDDTALRLDDKVNCKFPVPGSNSQPFEIAASLCAYVAIIADENPPKPYYDGVLYGVYPGTFADQWSYAQRDYIEKRGCSTSYVDQGFVKVGDALTCYHPLGVVTPGYRYVVDVVKTQFIVKSVKDYFESPTWQGKILVDDDDLVTNPEARKPRDAKCGIFGLIDQFCDMGVTVNRDLMKESTVCVIDPTNSSRINSQFMAYYSGAARIRNVDIDFTTEVIGG